MNKSSAHLKLWGGETHGTRTIDGLYIERTNGSGTVMLIFTAFIAE